jgi:hypothetical protein
MTEHDVLKAKAKLKNMGDDIKRVKRGEMIHIRATGSW